MFGMFGNPKIARKFENRQEKFFKKNPDFQTITSRPVAPPPGAPPMQERPIGLQRLMAPRMMAAGSLQQIGGMKKGGSVKKMAKGGSASSASKRADGIAQKGKTRGKIV